MRCPYYRPVIPLNRQDTIKCVCQAGERCHRPIAD